MINCISCTIICLLIILICKSFSANVMLSNRVIEIENVTPCPENNQLESRIRNLRFMRYNRTHKVLNYDITFKRPIDEKIAGSAMIEKWGNAGWVTIPFMPFQPNICNMMVKHFKDIWVTYNIALGVKHPENCPIPAGNYSMRNFVVDMSSVQMPIWQGKFKFKMMFLVAATKQVIFCSMHFFVSKEIM